MTRIGFKMQLHVGERDEYKRRHDAIWPELVKLLKDAGIKDYVIFLDEETLGLFATLTIDDPSRLAELPKHPVMQRWWSYMADIMETNDDQSPLSKPLQEMFYLQ